eukprot:1291467-Rhodomonas_salina.1
MIWSKERHSRRKHDGGDIASLLETALENLQLSLVRSCAPARRGVQTALSLHQIRAVTERLPLFLGPRRACGVQQPSFQVDLCYAVPPTLRCTLLKQHQGSSVRASSETACVVGAPRYPPTPPPHAMSGADIGYAPARSRA